jgi:hypothetical protein
MWDRVPIFAVAHQYGCPPMEVAHGGGIFMNTPRASRDRGRTRPAAVQSQVLDTFGVVRSAAHTEFIRSREGGALHLHETAARAGGACTVETGDAVTGRRGNGREPLALKWAKVELAGHVVRDCGHGRREVEYCLSG